MSAYYDHYLIFRNEAIYNSVSKNNVCQAGERQKNNYLEKGKNLNFEKVIRMPQKDVLSD